MNYSEFIDKEFRRVDEILSNTQTALDRMHRLDKRSASDIIREMKDIRNAISNLEMSFRAERDKIREKEEKENAELDAMKKGFYSDLSDEIELFKKMIKDIGLASDPNIVNTFADGWYKCKKHYGIQ